MHVHMQKDRSVLQKNYRKIYQGKYSAVQNLEVKTETIMVFACCNSAAISKLASTYSIAMNSYAYRMEALFFF